MFRRLVVALCVVLVVLPAAPAMADGADYEQVVDLTFPTDPDADFSHDYHAPRGDGTRVHKATDLMADKGTPLYAAVAGEVCWITGIDEPEPSYGYALRICGDDGRRYSYIHVNNDTPGTDDGMGGPEHAYAPGIRRGTRVGRGQLVGWMGDSGNGESTAPHLHFEIHDEGVTDPYGDHRIDPYNSLVAALDRGDVADGTAVATDRVVRVFGADRVGTAVAMSARRFAQADHAILAPAESPAEAIVAGPLAAALDAPVLTTWSSVVDDRVIAELRRLGVDGVTLVGDGLDAGLGDQLTDVGIAVDRLAGADRFGTAAAVAERVWELTDDPSSAPSAATVDGPSPGWPITAPTLVVSASPDRDGPVLLDRAQVGGEVYVSLTGLDAGAVDHVAFFVDAASTSTPSHVEREAPYDLAGTAGPGDPLPFDTRDLGNGDHEVTAVVVGVDGERTAVAATATVVNTAVRNAVVALGDHPQPDRSWPDSLMAAYHGSLTGTPVLLVRPDGLPAATAAAVETVEDATIIGGVAAVPAEVGTAVADLVTGDVERLFGATRLETALAVSQHAVDAGLVDTDRVWAATGYNWPDAVTAGSTVAAAGDVLVLVNGQGPAGDSAVGAWLRARAGRIASAVVIGGNAAVAPAAADALAHRIT